MNFENVLADLSPDRAWADLEHITREFPSRLAGTENARRMAEYARDELRAAGLDARLEEFLGLVSFPEPALVRVVSPVQRDIDAFTLGHSASTDGVEGELVYVGSGAESEYEGKDVRGKVTLSELSYSPARHEKAYIAWKRGSVAQIMMNWGDENNTAVPFGSMKSAWGNPTPETLEAEVPQLPCVGIARTDGLWLKRLCEQGPVRVWLRARAENGWRKLTMTAAELDTGPDREFVLLGGHMDSWFGPQATDNAAGDACILELARVFGRHRDRLRRGLAVGLWMGHETGTMVSSTRFADTNWDRLRVRCVAYIQIDQPAMTGASVWNLHSTDEAQTFIIRATREVTGDMPLRWHRQAKTGDMSFFGVGLPSLAGEMSFTDEEIRRTALATLGWWHHSIHNTLDKVDRNLLGLHLRVYARWLWELLTEPVLPFEYGPVADRLLRRLTELAATRVPGIDLDGLVERAHRFKTLAERFDAQAQAWRSRLRGDQAGADAAGLLNGTMMRLARVLIPVASTVVGPYGQDRYGHSWQTQVIPALVAYSKLANLDPDSEAYQVWWVAAIRARNRVADALEQSVDIVQQALDRLDS
jgi:hypothetical protein